MSCIPFIKELTHRPFYSLMLLFFLAIAAPASFSPIPPSLLVPLCNTWPHSSYVTHSIITFSNTAISSISRLLLQITLSFSPSVPLSLKWLSLCWSAGALWTCQTFVGCASLQLRLIFFFFPFAATCRIHRSTSHICSSSLQQAHTPTYCTHKCTKMSILSLDSLYLCSIQIDLLNMEFIHQDIQHMYIESKC